MEYLILLLAVFVFFVITSLVDRKKRKKRQIMKIKEAWGQRPDREYTYEEFENITKYFAKRTKGFAIDDITWNDLDMNTVFMLINNTQSSLGEQYLYYLLRTPLFEENTLKERERLIDYFRSQEEERTKLQILFQSIGRIKTLSMVDYLENLEHVERKSILPHILMNILLFVAIGLLFVDGRIGGLLLITSIGINIISYYKYKNGIEPYIITFGYIMNVLKGVDGIEKLNIREIETYTKELKEAKDKFKGFRRNAHLLLAGDRLTGALEDIMMDYFRIVFHIDIMKFYSMLRVVDKNRNKIDILLENIGILESVIAIGSFRETLAYYTVPDFSYDTVVSMRAEDIYHPMIDQPVSNSIDTEKSILVTGSNASGKSTFLKTVALCSILSQTIFTVPARYYRGNYFKVLSSMSLRDSLMNKDSYYIVEIKALKRILDESKKGGNLLCFIDEVLRGTNTVERIAASAQILKSLDKKNVLCFAATHDIELTYLMQQYYDNYHFKEEIEENDIFFNYQLLSGRTDSQNAIKLLSVIGYDDSIIHSAQESARGFIKNGKWQL